MKRDNLKIDMNFTDSLFRALVGMYVSLKKLI